MLQKKNRISLVGVKGSVSVSEGSGRVGCVGLKFEVRRWKGR